MAKIVARMMKLKAENLKGIEVHNQRETDQHSNKDIDVERSALNYDLIHSKNINYKKQITTYINENRISKRAIRKDAVLIDEWILTSSPDFFIPLGDTKPFFNACLDYFADRCGRENIQYAMVHLDESTPHMHLGITPLTDGRLNHKMMFDRQALIDIQEELPRFLNAKGFEIERGEKGSERKHLTVPEYKELKEELRSFEQAITHTDKILEKKNAEADKVFANVRTLETKQTEIIDSLKMTVIPDLENLKEKRFSLNGVKYVLSDSDLSTIKSVVSNLNALKTKNRHLEDENSLLESKNIELTQQNQKNTKELTTLSRTLDEQNKQVADFEVRQSAFEKSDQLTYELKIKTERVADLEKENTVLNADLTATQKALSNLETKYTDLKNKFDGLTTYLHEIGGDTKEIIIEKIKKGITRMQNAPKIKNYLAFYSIDKTYYVAGNGDLYLPENDPSNTVTIHIGTEFAPLQPPKFNKETGLYEFIGEYMFHGYPKTNTLYLSEQDILANNPFSFEHSTDSYGWKRENQRSTSYSQDQGWTR